MDPETWEGRMESEAVADWLDSMTVCTEVNKT